MRKPQRKTGDCFMCRNECIDPPAEGSLATGSRIDERDTYYGGNHAGEYRRMVFRGYVCDMHANGDDILSIRYL